MMVTAWCTCMRITTVSTMALSHRPLEEHVITDLKQAPGVIRTVLRGATVRLIKRTFVLA